MFFQKKAYTLAWVALIVSYLFFYNLGYHQEWGLDFMSYYASAQRLAEGGDPYQGEMVVHYPGVSSHPVSGNPNPPVTLAIFSALASFSFPVAFIGWIVFSTGLTILGVYRVLQCIAPHLLKKEVFIRLLMFYFASFPMLSNAMMLQLGGVLLFLLMQGYAAYLKRQEGTAALWWGGLIALKLFPGLLILYAWVNRRYRLSIMMVGVALFVTCLPLGWIPLEVYKHYMTVITHQVSWYGTNWNFSYLGELYRGFVVTLPSGSYYHYYHTWLLSKTTLGWLYALGAGALVGWWCLWARYFERNSPHQGFSVAILVMLFLSPLAWLYYFPLLLIPVLCTLMDGIERSWRLVIWFLSITLFYVPEPAAQTILPAGLAIRLGLLSVYSYGFLILSYLTCTLPAGTDPCKLRWENIPSALKRGLILLVVSGFGVVWLRTFCRWYMGVLPL